MTPYIVALIFLIVIILWQVYSMTESFETAPTTTGEKLAGFLARLKSIEEKASNQSFPIDITEADFRIAMGAPPTGGPPAPDLSTSEKFVEFIKTTQPRFEELLAQIKKGDYDANGLQSIEENYIPPIEKIVNFVESTYDKYAPKSTTSETPTIPNTGTLPVPSDSTKSGLMVNLEDLWGAIGPLSSERQSLFSKQDASGNVVGPSGTAMDASGNGVEIKAVEKQIQVLKPQEVKVTCAPPVKAEASSPEYNQELEDRIAKNIVKQVKDELIANRQTHGPVDESSPYASCDLDVQSDSMTQGVELQQARPTISQYPDMSQYIRKDNIPCAKCNLSS